MHLRSYPEYKESGVPWLGLVPKEWGIHLNGNIFSEVVDTNHPDLELLSMTITKGVVKQSSTGRKIRASEDRSNYKKIKEGDIGYNLMNAFFGGIGESRFEGILSPAYAVCRPRIGISARYYHYLFRTPIYMGVFNSFSYGIMFERNRLYFERFKIIASPVPSLSEQNQIARYLDWKTVQIAKFIKDKKRMIELLQEQKQVIINDAVTGKIDVTTGKPYPKYKDSGVEWLGQVPKDWNVSRIKQNAKILRGKFSHRPRNDPRFYNGNYPFIQTGDIARAGKYVTGFKQTLNENGLGVSKIFPKGTLLMTIAANIGDVAILDFDACFPDSIVGFVPDLNLNLDFLYYLFTTMKQELLKDAPVNTQGNLNIERIGVMRIPLPSIKEQISIIESIQSKTATLALVISRTEREIALMHEYRDRLIADVVTGKLDVRGIAVPEVLEELSADDADEDPDEIENEEEA